MFQAIMKFLRDEEGASAVEYGLILGLIAVAAIVILGTLGDQLEGVFTSASDKLTAEGLTGGGGGN